jgi:quaternary ammonium compound-resistance protein SugE
MAWILVFAAGLLEVVWAYLMKQSDGFTRPWETAGTLVTMLGSFGLLALAMKSLPLGAAYAVWTGIGAIGAFAAGVFLLGEAANPGRVAAAGLIVAGIFLMKFSTPG